MRYALAIICLLVVWSLVLMPPIALYYVVTISGAVLFSLAVMRIIEMLEGE